MLRTRSKVSLESGVGAVPPTPYSRDIPIWLRNMNDQLQTASASISISISGSIKDLTSTMVVAGE